MPKGLEPLPIFKPSDPRDQLYGEDGKLKPLSTKEYPMPEKPEMEKISVGIEETKDALKFFVAIANSFVMSWKDGLSLSDIVNFGKPAMLLIPFLAGAKYIPTEIIDIDEAEFSELLTVVKNELDLEDEKAAQIVNAVLEIIKQIRTIVGVATSEQKQEG